MPRRKSDDLHYERTRFEWDAAPDAVAPGCENKPIRHIKSTSDIDLIKSPNGLWLNPIKRLYTNNPESVPK